MAEKKGPGTKRDPKVIVSMTFFLHVVPSPNIITHPHKETHPQCNQLKRIASALTIPLPIPLWESINSVKLIIKINYHNNERFIFIRHPLSIYNV